MSQPEPILPHMPDHIKKRIMDSSDTNSKLILRQCSKSFDIQFAETWIHYEHLDLYWNCDNEYIRIRFKSCDESEKQVTYHDFRNGYLVEYANGNPQKIVKNGNFIDAAVEQFVKAFKKRKVFLKVLKINYQTHYFQENRFKRHRKRLISKLACHLASLKHTIHVKNFAMHIDPNARDISRILPFFEPGLLQTILFRRQEGGSNDGDFDLSSIIGMEQWKKARSFRAEDYRLNLGHEDTKHFEESEYVGKLDLESLKTILKNLHNHSNWTFRWIRCREFDYAAIGRYLSENAQAVHPSVLPEFFLHFEIPNFCFLDIENGLGITISSYK